MEAELKDDYIQALREDMASLQSNSWHQTMAMVAMEREIEDLKREKGDLELEVDWLRDRLSEKPYA